MVGTMMMSGSESVTIRKIRYNKINPNIKNGDDGVAGAMCDRDRLLHLARDTMVNVRL